MSETPETDRIVWIDCEMTGLDFKNDLLVEIACVITNAQLEVVAEGLNIVIQAPTERLESMDPFVVNMHTESGLLPEIPNGVSLEAAEEQLFDYISSHSVHVDRIFLQRDMPRVDSYLHYRIIDVSSIKELVRRWYPRAYFASPTKTGNHRALGDILDSINELKYYREAVFVELPGPDSSTAKVIAAKHAPN